MSTSLATRIADEHAGLADQLPATVIAPDRRAEAIRKIVATGLPTPRDDNWKYANLRLLDRVRFAPVQPATTISAADLPKPVKGYARYVVVDGVLRPELSAPIDRASDAQIKAISTAHPQTERSDKPPSSDRDAIFALLNEAFARDSLNVAVNAEANEPACIEVVFVATAEAKNGASYPRLLIEVGARSRLTLIERYVSAGSDSNFVNSAVSVQLNAGATVDHYRVQQTGARAMCIDTLSVSVPADATYKLNTVNLGAQSARSTVNICLTGARAQTAIHGVSVADRTQVHDVHVHVEHAAPDTRTDEIFRGIAGGRSRVAFNGKVTVRANAQRTDSRQSLRGLLAGPDAEVDVRPQLEIYTDDVRCSHGATAGKLDDAMLFYLLSRGIDRETAQHLLKWAFLEDVVSRIAVPELRRQIEESLVGQMQESTALKELL